MARVAAIGALVLMAASVILAVITAVQSFPRGITVLVCLLAAVAVAWWALLRRGVRRWVGAAAAVALIVGALLFVVFEGQPLRNVLIIVGVGLSLAAARRVFTVHVELTPARAPAHPVLFYNPKSGGGKSERFRVAEEAGARGVEAIELQRGDDLETLVRAAVERGADALGMAGGDGSQAIVAAVAAEYGLPYVCVPAGTRNHFALDLGVDRDDVVGALDAFTKGGERVVDLAEVNGRVFVNNVSLGIYAEAVQKESYRNAKLRTLADTLSTMGGPDGDGVELGFTGPDGRRCTTSEVLLVSNDVYRLGRALGSGTRPRLDAGELGIAAVGVHAADRPTHGLSEWSAPAFEVESDQRVAAGIDGEAAQLDPPLRFRTRPGALRVRIAPQHPGASPSAKMPTGAWNAVREVARVAAFGAG
ncbi:MAG: diacylglycerol/lipid kinase family protein [Solirubrobacteraceae bacterium]